MGLLAACLIGLLLLFPGICSIRYLIAYPKDQIGGAFAWLFLIADIPLAVIAVVLIYRAFRPYDS